MPVATLTGVAQARIRNVAGIAGRLLLGILAAVFIGGAALILLAYYSDFEFDIEAVVISLLAAGVLVFLWSRWR
jgi:hypothetical protein